MNYLLDTHVLLWWLISPEKIRKKAHEIIKDKSNTIYVSTASLWEMAIKKGLGRLTLPHNLIETIASEEFKLLAVLADEALGVADLPAIHTDPFDRLLIMQAKLRDLVIITHDSKILEYPIVTLKA